MRKITAVLFLAICCVPKIAFCQTQDENLRGLPGVNIVVAPLDSETSLGDLTQDQIEDEVASRLRAAGINVGVTFRPILKIFVVAATTKHQREHAIIIQIELDQKVFLNRDLTISSIAPTWSHAGVAIVHKNIFQTKKEYAEDYNSTVMEAVAAEADYFIKRYQSKNQ